MHAHVSTATSRPPWQAILDKEADLKTEQADMAASLTPVDTLVLAIHGIGQTLSNANIASVREPKLPFI